MLYKSCGTITIMAAAPVTRHNLNSSPFDIIFSVVDNRTYIADPRDKAGKRTRKLVYDHDPILYASDFSLAPFIVVGTPVKASARQGADSSTKEITWEQDIKIVTMKEGSGQNRDDLGRQDMHVLMDAMDRAFESKEIRDYLKTFNLNLRTITLISALVPIMLGERVAFETAYKIVYRSRIVVQENVIAGD